MNFGLPRSTAENKRNNSGVLEVINKSTLKSQIFFMCHMDYIEDLIEKLTEHFRLRRRFEPQEYSDLGFDAAVIGRSGYHRLMLLEMAQVREE